MRAIYDRSGALHLSGRLQFDEVEQISLLRSMSSCPPSLAWRTWAPPGVSREARLMWIRVTPRRRPAVRLTGPEADAFPIWRWTHQPTRDDPWRSCFAYMCRGISRLRFCPPRLCAVRHYAKGLRKQLASLRGQRTVTHVRGLTGSVSITDAGRIRGIDIHGLVCLKNDHACPR